MFSSSHSKFSNKAEYSPSLALMTSRMYWTKSKKTSLIPRVSYPMLNRSFTSGRLHKISENFIMLLMCDSYFFDFSSYPVRDLMNYRLRAVWMHLL
jgi:hypothetical protein